MNFKTTSILFVLTAILGLYAFVTREKDSVLKESNDVHKLVDVGSTNDVSKVVITDATGKKTSLEKQGKKWRMTEPYNTAADDTEVTTLVGLLAAMKSEKQTESNPTKDAETGIDKPRFTVAITGSGKTAQVRIGNNMAIGKNVYAKVDGTSIIEMIPVEIVEKLDRPAGALRDLRLVEVGVSDIHKLVVSSNNAITLSMEQAPKAWTITAPQAVPADPAAVTDLLSQIASLRANSFVDDSTSAAEVMKNPSMEVSYSTTPPSTQPAASRPADAFTTITFGDYDITKKTIHVRVGNSPFVAKVNASVVDAFKKTPLDLRDKVAVDILPEEVSKITITSVASPATKPTTTPATKPSVVERRPVTESGVPFLPMPVDEIKIEPPSKFSLSNYFPKRSKWYRSADPKSNMNDAEVDTLLNGLHPLRAEKYLDTYASTQATGRYEFRIQTSAAGGAAAREHVLKVIDPGNNQNLIVESSNGLTFEVSRGMLSNYFDGEFKPKAPANNGPPMGMPAGMPGNFAQ